MGIFPGEPGLASYPNFSWLFITRLHPARTVQSLYISPV